MDPVHRTSPGHEHAQEADDDALGRPISGRHPAIFDVCKQEKLT